MRVLRCEKPGPHPSRLHQNDVDAKWRDLDAQNARDCFQRELSSYFSQLPRRREHGAIGMVEAVKVAVGAIQTEEILM